MSGPRTALTDAEIEALYADGQGMTAFARRVEAAALRHAIIMPGWCWEIRTEKGEYVTISATVPRTEWLAYLEGTGATK